MARNDYKAGDMEKPPAGIAELKPKAVDEIHAAKRAEPSLEGLVKMHQDGKQIHAHPDVVKHHQGNGWKLA